MITVPRNKADLVVQCGVPNLPIVMPLIDGPVEQLQVFGDAAQSETGLSRERKICTSRYVIPGMGARSERMAERRMGSRGNSSL